MAEPEFGDCDKRMAEPEFGDCDKRMAEREFGDCDKRMAEHEFGDCDKRMMDDLPRGKEARSTDSVVLTPRGVTDRPRSR